MADNQDPLAALQKLLADQKAEVNSNSASNSGSTQDVTENVSPPLAEVVTGPTAEEITLLQKKKEEEDNLEIEEQLLKMKTELQDTPQYQARLSQKQANEAVDEKKRLEERSKRIFQLKHLEND